MASELNDWLKKKCAENGGVDEVIIYNICDRDTLEVENGVITELTMKLGKQAYKITPDMESATATETSTRSRENNSLMVAQTGLIVLKDDDNATVDLVEEMSKGFLGIIMKKSDPENALYRHYGLLNGMVVETAEGVLGQLYEDLRGHTINLVGKELAKAPSISETIVETMLVPVS